MSVPWNLSCPNWQDRIRTGRSLIPDLPIDKVAANKAISVFNKLKLPDVIGTPLLRDAAGEWFREFVGVIFGSLINNERMIREGFLLVPKKSSKTSYGAGLKVTAILLNLRPRAEFLFIGPTKTIADLAFSQASGMIEADSYLKSRFQIQDHLKKITDHHNKASLQIKAFDTSVLTGSKPSGVLIDELHEISANSAATRIIGQIRGGLLPNPEAFLLFITTQSDIEPSGVFKAELTMARAIRDGKAQGKMLPIIYEFPPEIVVAPELNENPPWYNPKYWPMVNPNLGRPVTVERLIEDFETAKQAGETEIRRWASQHLNIEIGISVKLNRWAGALYWERQGEDLSLNDIIDRSEVLSIGIDGGGLDDLLSLCILGRETSTKRWMAWTKSWVKSSMLEIRKADAARLRDFESDGDLTLVDELGEDIQQLADLCLMVYYTGKLSKIGLDPMGVGAIIDALDEREIDTGKYCIGISQGWKMTGAIKTTERKLADGTFVHCKQPINAWAIGNAKVELKGNALVITKQISGLGKIDPLTAIFDAGAVMSTNPEARGSIYDDEKEYQKVFGKKSETFDDRLWSPEVLRDVHHPLFNEHKLRFEAWQAKQPDDDLDQWIRR